MMDIGRPRGIPPYGDLRFTGARSIRIDPGSFLKIEAYAYNAIAPWTATFELRILVEAPDGNLTRAVETFRFGAGVDRSLQTFIFPAPVGILVASEIAVTSTANEVKQGQVYCRLVLTTNSAGTIVLATVMAGSVSSSTKLCYPLVQNDSMIPLTYGYIQTFFPSDPAAGAEFSQTVPTNAVWRIRGLYLPLTTSATVATRMIHLIVDDGTFAFLNLPASDSQTASSGRNYVYGDVLGRTQVDGIIPTKFPTDLILVEGWRIRTSTTNFQATDDFGQPVLYLESWIQE